MLKRPGRAPPSSGETDPRSLSHRNRPDTTQVPLPIEAIGIIEADDGLCTATLVTPNLALTAAHCLFDALGRIRVPEQFRGGFKDGAFTVDSLITRAFMPPGFDYRQFNRSLMWEGKDWALIELAEPVGTITGVVPVTVLSEDQLAELGDGSDGFVEVGYGTSEGEAPVVLRGCTIFTAWDDNTIGHLCGTVDGDSGAPDLVLVDGRWMIFAIESAEVDAGDIQGVDTSVTAAAFAAEVERRGGIVVY